MAYKFDDTNPDARTARLLADRAIQTAAGRQDAVHAENELVHETGARYIDFVVPGLLGMNLMGSAMWGLGFCDCRGAAEEAAQAAGGFAHAALAIPGVVPAVAAGDAGDRGCGFSGLCAVAFGVPFRGSLWQLGLLCLLTSLAFSALGLLVSSRAKTMEAVSGLMNLVMLPMWILSGVFFSATRFPAVIQPLVRALPLTAAIDAHARKHAAGNRGRTDAAASGHTAGVVRGSVCGFAAHLPLALIESSGSA